MPLKDKFAGLKDLAKRMGNKAVGTGKRKFGAGLIAGAVLSQSEVAMLKDAEDDRTFILGIAIVVLGIIHRAIKKNS